MPKVLDSQGRTKTIANNVTSATPGIVSGRLTLASGTPVTTTDQTAKTTVYFTPYRGNTISLYGSTGWTNVSFSEVSTAVPSTLFRCFDVFGYLSSGTLALETLNWNQTTGSITAATNATPVVVTSNGHGLSVNDVVGIASMGGLTSLNTKTWHITAQDANTFTLGGSAGNGAYTSGGTWYKINNTRATALVATTGGVYTKSGDPTRLYLGTGCTTGTSGQTEDSYGGASQAGGKRFVWNYYNRIRRNLGIIEGTDSWTYAVTAYRAANGNGSNKVEMVVGVAEDMTSARLQVRCGFDATNAGNLGIGLDSTTTQSAQVFQDQSMAGNNSMAQDAMYSGIIPVGYHFLQWLENRRAGTMTYYGDGGVSITQSGMLAEMVA